MRIMVCAYLLVFFCSLICPMPPVPPGHNRMLFLNSAPPVQERAGIPQGLSLSLSYSNYHPSAARLNLASMAIDNLAVAQISPRTAVKDSFYLRGDYQVKIEGVQTSICALTQELKAVINAPGQNVAAALYTHLQKVTPLVAGESVTQSFVCDAIASCKYYLTSSGSLKSSLTASEAKKLCGLIDDCRDRALRLLERTGSSYSACQLLGREREVEIFKDAGIDLLEQKIGELFGFKDDQTVHYFQQALQAQRYTDAWKVVTEATGTHRAFLESVYTTKFNAQFIAQGIDKRYLADPYAVELAKQLPVTRLPSVYNYELEKRLKQKNNFLAKCRISAPLPEVDQLVYRLLDRMSDPVVVASVQQMAEYLQRGASADPLAKEYTMLGHAIEQALLGKADAVWLEMPDLLQSPAHPHHQAIKDEVVKYLSSSEVDTTHCRKLGNMYVRMLEGDLIAQSFLEQALVPGMSGTILAIDVDKIHQELFDGAGALPAQTQVKHFENIVQAHRDIAQNGLHYFEKDCNISLITRLFMMSKGENFAAHLKYRGNQLDHVLHDAILENYQRGAELTAQKVPAQAEGLVEAAGQSTVLASQCLVVRDYTNAINFSSFAARAYDYLENYGKYIIQAGQHIAQGAAEGGYNGVVSIAHQLCHPIETVRNMALGLHNLTTILYRVCRADLQLKVASLRDPQHLEQHIERYYQDIGIDMDALQAKLEQITLKDVAREGAQFLTEGFLLGQIFKFSGVACRAVREQAHLLTSDRALAQISDRVATVVPELTEIATNLFRDKVTSYVQKSSSYADEFRKLSIEIPSKKVIKHIISSHYEIGPDFTYNLQSKSIRSAIFKAEENFIELGINTLKQGTKTGSNCFTHDFQRIIGFDKYGRETSKVMIALGDEGKKIATIFPISM